MYNLIYNEMNLHFEKESNLFFSKQGLTMWFQLYWNSLYNPGWPPTLEPPASASQVLG
jgi:hypothetical protein